MDIITTGLMIGTSVFMVWACVGICLWHPMKNIYIDDLAYVEDVFEDRYYLETDLKANEIADVSNKYTMVYHPEYNTNIIMGYKDEFIYWANCELPYGTLLTVARKFCLEMGCFGLYKGNKLKCDELKKDNIVRIKIDGKIRNIIKDSEVPDNKRNVFKRMGSMNDFTFLRPVPHKVKNISYLDFKQRQKVSNAVKCA
jgi:hypothetical protein